MTDAVRPDTLDYYRSWLSYRQWYLRVPGVQVAVAVDGTLRMSAAFGSADLATGSPLTDRHLFRIASHSKTFTAVAVLQLAEQGRLRLDDTLASHLDELAGSPLAQVTVRELLTHSAGVIRDSEDGDFWQLLRDFPSRAELLAIANEQSAGVLARNERFKYSNIGYGLLGLIIEAVTGRSYHEQVTDTIIGRLGLRDTGPELVEPRRADFAAGHSALAYAADRRVIEHIDTDALAAATGFYATASDLVTFFSALLPDDDRLLGADSQRELRHPHWTVKEPETRYGLGVFLTRLGERDLFGHSGGYPGHITRTLACPDRRLVVSVLTNAIDGAAESLATALIRFTDLAESATHQRSENASRFTGRFSWLWGVQDVALIDGYLFAVNPTAINPAEDPVPLEVVDDTTLKIVGGPGGGSIGELMHYEFADDGSIRTVRGGSGMTMTPFELGVIAEVT
ncbi:MAG: beta-lactamase family protein [Actinomycetota bacterium]|nr:beta-lactamase family protein [Actinomycetota bacterium]